MPNGTITDAPYKPGTISAPLTPEQRANVLAWCTAAVAYGIANGWHFSNHGDLTSLSDADLLKEYAMLYTVVHVKFPGMTLNPFNAGTLVNPFTGQDVQNPLTSVNQFLTNLANPHLWLRVGEFAVGGIILAIGLNAILRPGQPLPKPTSIAKAALV